jgi:MFS superfamily sulfate permease-like transporter
MVNLFHDIHRKINGLIWSLISTGVILILLAVLIVWTDFMLRLTAGLIILVVAYTFIYAGYKLHSMKRSIEQHLKIR